MSLLLFDGVLVEDFETLGDWTLGGSAGSAVEADVAHYRTGSQSLRLSVPVDAFSNGTLVKTISRDFETAKALMSFWVYNHGTRRSVHSIRIRLSSSASLATYKEFDTADHWSGAWVHEGWNCIHIAEGDWVDVGGEDWANTMIRLQFVAYSQTGYGDCAVSFDELRVLPVAEPAILISFDDGYESSYDEGFTYMESLGLRGTFFVITDDVGDSGKMTESDLINAHSKGWAVANHTTDHTDLSTLSTAAEVLAKVAPAAEYLEGLGCTRAARHLAYPLGGYDDLVLSTLEAEGIVTARTTIEREQAPVIDNALLVTSKLPTSTTTLVTVEGWVDDAIARQATLVLTFHSLVAAAPVSTQWLISDFQDLCDYIVASGVAVLTIDEWYARVAEAAEDTQPATHAAYFDGINDYTSLGDLGVFEDKSGGIIGWLWLPDVVGDHVVFSEYNSAGAQHVTLTMTGATLEAVAHDGTNTTTITGGTLTAETWHHFALVADGTNLLLYLTGAVVDSDTLPALALTVDTMVLGKTEAGTEWLFGALADVRLYPFGPDADEVLADFEYGIPLPDLALALWPTTIDELVTEPAQTVVVVCTAYLSGVSVATLDVVGGSVTADARRSQLRNGSVEFALSADLTLAAAYSLLQTPGLELALARGFRLPDDSEVTAALGRFIIDEVTYDTTGSGEKLSATLSDLSARIARARWTDPYQIASGTALADALNAILSDRWPDVSTAITSSNCLDTLTAGVVFEAGSDSDPWADACALATAHGYSLYFDTEGRAAVTVVPDPASVSARFTFARGTTAIVTEEQRAVPMERIRNGVIASGEGSELDVPVRGEAWDEDPASPTYRYGPFGQVPRFYSSPLLTTDEMCETAATTLLRTMLGRSETLAWQHVAHPGLAPLDVVALEDAEGTLRRYVLDEVTVPLDIAAAMSAKARDTLVEE